MKFKPPKEIEVGGQVFKIIHTEDLRKMAGAFGQAHLMTGEIYLDTKGTPEDTQAITYFHEVFHCILDTLGRKELCQDEAFVDSVANLFWQTQKTAKY
jgi:hypothetical protein